MTKLDGSLKLDGAPTPLMEVLLRRRSVRKYEGLPATKEQVQYVEACVASFQARMQFHAPRIVVIARGAEFDTVVRAATAGLVGKINPWLGFTKASHLVLCGAVYPSHDQHHIERAIAEASMAMQVGVLAATDVGLATCWMAGIHHDRVETTYPMPDGAKLIAMSTLGTGPSRLRLSWDAVAYHLVSKRRKPLDQLWMSERWTEAR